MTLTKSSIIVSAWKYWRETLTGFLDWSGSQADLASLRPADYCLGIWFKVLGLNNWATENGIAPVHKFQDWIPLTSCGEKGNPPHCGWNPSMCLSNGCCWHPWRIDTLSIFVMVAGKKKCYNVERVQVPKVFEIPQLWRNSSSKPVLM